MVDPFSIISLLRAIGSLALGISNLLGQSHENKEECHRLRKHIDTVIAVAEDLRRQLKAANVVEDENSPVSVAFKGLQEALDSSLGTVDACVKNKGLYGTLKAGGIAKKLRAVDDEITKKLVAAVAATTACHISISAKIKESVDALRAEMKHRDDALRAELKHRDDALRAEMKHRDDVLRADMKHMLKDYAFKNNTRGRDASSNSSVFSVKHSNQIPNNALPGVHVPREARSSSSRLLQRTMEPGDSSSSKKISKAHSLKLFCFTTWDPKKKTMQWAMTLTNNRRHSYFAVWIDPPRNEQFTCPRKTKVKPRSTLALSVTMKMHEQPPRDMGKFDVLMISVKKKRNADKLQSASVHGKLTLDNGNKVLGNNRMQGEVYLERPTAITCEPTRCQIIRRIQTKTGTTLRPIEVHPKKKWVVMTSEETGGCVIWDYQQEIKVMELQVKMKQRVCSAKFIVQKEWLAVGTGDASIYIYSYTGSDELREVDSFKAYAGCSEEETKAYADKAINSLAVHPRELRLLLAFGCTIMQWQYLRDDHTWKRIRKIEMRSPVRSLKYNPRPRGGADTFVSVTRDNEAKIYTTDFSSDPAITLEGTYSGDYYPTDSNRHWVVTCQNASTKCEIRDFKKRKVVHTIEVSGLEMVQVACHPTHQILATSTFPKDQDKRNTKDRGTGSTTLEDGIIYVWDANTYRLQETVQIPGMGSRHSMEFATDDRNGLTRLFVKFENKMAIVEVNLPVSNTSQRTGLWIRPGDIIPWRQQGKSLRLSLLCYSDNTILF